MSSLDQGKSSPKPVATSTTRSVGGVSDSLDEILDRFVEDHIDLRGMDSESRGFYLEDKAAAKAQIKAWVAEEIIPKFSDMPSFSADQMDGFRQACLKMEAKLKES